MTTSTRTIVRDALLDGFAHLKAGGEGRVSAFSVSPRYLAESESSTRNTYCVIVTDEVRSANTQQHDNYALTIKVVIYAHDQKDPRAVLDAMIEDAIDTVRAQAAGLIDQAWQMTLVELSTDEGTTEAGPWAQAVLRWQALHRRPVL